MSTFSELLKRAWGTVFRDQGSFWMVFLLSSGMGILIMILFYVFGYNVTNPGDLQNMIQEIWPYILFMFLTLVFGTIMGFFGMLCLTKIFQGKQVTLTTLLSEWKKIFPYIGTMVCAFLYYMGIVIALLITIGIFFGLGYLWMHLVSGFTEGTAFLINIFGVILAVIVGIALVSVFIWILISFFTFLMPAFFLDDIKYFDTPLQSKRIITGRWWNTFGKMLLGFLCLGSVSIIISILQRYILVTGSAGLFLSIAFMSIQGIAGLVFASFTFYLYEDLKSHPVDKTVKKEALKNQN